MPRPMKPSGVEWIGDFPQGWKICRIKHMANIFTGNSIKDEHKKFYEDPIEAIPYISTKDVDTTLQTINFSNGMYIKLSDESFKRAPAHSTLLCIEGGSAGKKIAYTEQQVCFVNKLCCFHSNSCSNKYLYYYLMSPAFTQLFNSHISGLIGGVSIKALSNFKILLPPLDEQKRIAAFLDDKCARIDNVIEKTRASVEEYKKLKQALITRAVTKGIRPARPMKPGGVEWLGDIPADWELVQLKRFVSVNNGREVPEEIDKTSDAVPVYGSGGIFKYTTDYLCDGEAVMFGRKGTLGKPVYTNEKFWTVDTMYYLTFSDKLFAKFNYYQLVAFDWEPHITQTALPSIVASEIVSCKFAFPPLDEQKEIAAYLDAKTAAIDSLIAKKNQLVTELTSLKKSLIFEYVTGKKEVTA